MKCFIVALSFVALTQSRVVPSYSVGRTTVYPTVAPAGRYVTNAGTVGQFELYNQVNSYSVPYQSQYVQQYGQTPVQTPVQQNVIQRIQQTPSIVYRQSGYGTTVPQTQLGYLNQNQGNSQRLGLVQQVLQANNAQRQLQQQSQYGLGQSPVPTLVQQILGQNAVGQQETGLSGQSVGASGQVYIPHTQLVQLIQQVLEQNGVQSGVPQQVFGNNVDSSIYSQLVNAVESQQTGQNLNVLEEYPAGQQVLALLQQLLPQQVGQTTPTNNQVIVNYPGVGTQGVIYPVYAY